ncbi:dynein axonemal heavy chain 8-like [Phlebotomus argentipes]|uniref:dynein axonemal heavy chain 8-like n=1 Tax=Phlebotomus argentipes TaxID=94469 RepID=UPI0028931E46|nr:dynein axonemal heavy chain 8-like [Phlebotomus argentipes]
MRKNQAVFGVAAKVQKWLGKKKTPQFTEDLRKFQDLRVQRESTITPLHKIVFEIVAQHFQIDQSVVVDGYLDTEENVQFLSNFFSKHGQLAIFFSYGLFPLAPVESGQYHSLEMWQAAVQWKRIVISTNEPTQLNPTCVIIYRVDNTENITIRNHQNLIYSKYFKAQKPDNQTAFTRFLDDFEGLLKSDPLQAIESDAETGSLTGEFLSISHSIRTMDDALKSKPVYKIDQELFKGFLINTTVIKETSRNPKKVSEIEKVFSKWMKGIKRILVRGEQIYRDSRDAQPANEFMHWRRIVFDYAFIKEDIKKPEFANVVQCLTLAGSSLLKEWKIIQENLHIAYIQANDIYLFLNSVVPFFKDLHEKSPQDIIIQFTGFLTLIKNVSEISQYYRTPMRICEFVSIFVNQLILVCHNYIEGKDGSVWLQQRSKVIEKIQDSRHFLDTFEEKYHDIANWECSMKHIFHAKSQFMDKLHEIEEILIIMESSSVLDRIRMTTMDPFAVRMKENFQEIVKAPLSPFSRDNKTFGSLHGRFIKQTEKIEEEIFVKMKNMVQECPSSSSMLLLLKQYSKFNLRPLCIEQQHFAVINKLEEEISEIYTAYRNESGKGIQYGRCFLRKFEDPVKSVMDLNSPMLTEKMTKSLYLLNTLKDMIKQEEEAIFDSWKSRMTGEINAALKEPVFVKKPEHPGYYVNFNEKIYLRIRECDQYVKMQFKLPKVGKILLTAKNDLLSDRDALMGCAKIDLKMRRAIPAAFLDIIYPLLNDVDRLFREGQTVICWMSSSLPSYIEKLNKSLKTLMDRVKQISDRVLMIEEYLEEISETCLATVPDAPVTIDNLKKMNLDHLTGTKNFISARSSLMEQMVIDLIQVFCDLMEFQDDKYDWINFADLPRIVKLPTEESETSRLYREFDEDNFDVKQFHKLCMDVFNYFYDQFLISLKNCFLNTVEVLKSHLIREYSENGKPVPIIESSLILKIESDAGEFSLLPSIQNIEDGIQEILTNLIYFFKSIASWGFKAKTRNHLAMSKWESEYPKTVYAFLSERVEMHQILLNFKMNVKEEVHDFVEKLRDRYEYLWTVNQFNINKKIISSNPSVLEIQTILEEISQELSDAEARKEGNFVAIPVRISLAKAMDQIVHVIWMWRENLTSDMLSFLRKNMAQMMKFILQHTKLLKKPVRDIHNLEEVFQCLRIVVESYTDTDIQLTKATDVLNLLRMHRSSIPDDDYEIVYRLERSHRELMGLESEKRVELLNLYRPMEEYLMQKSQEFEEEWIKFEKEYHESGPLIPDISAKTASDRFFLFSARFNELLKLFELVKTGERLFGYPSKENKNVLVRKTELESLSKLYSLYNEVHNLDRNYRLMKWFNVYVEDMMENLKEIQARYNRLPNSLKRWKAYEELKRKLTEMNDLCPLIGLLRNDAMKDHHWSSLSECLNINIDVESDEFTLGTILDTHILDVRDEVENIGISALKEKDIEEKLRQIDEMWTNMRFPSSPFKGRGNFLLKGTETQDLLAQIDDALLILNSLAANKYNAIFMNRTLHWIDKLSKTSNNLDMWLQVQDLWLYLEAVFASGDISRQLPVEARLFSNVDLNFSRIVHRALSIDKVIECSTHPDLQVSFPIIMQQLEQCLKSLSSYLEKKRRLFPRFFFVSDEVLIQILGQSNEPKNIQTHFLSLFDALARVEFKENSPNIMEAFLSSNGEKVPMINLVSCTENVEIWLGELLKTMQDTIKSVTADMSRSVVEKDFDFVKNFDKYTGQMGIIGLQVLWTHLSETALMKSKRDSSIMKETNKSFLNLLNQLIEQTALELSSLDRIKYEAMITIHLHQRDIFQKMYSMKVSSPQNFEWQKQQRFYLFDETDTIAIRITNVKFTYQNEYLGVTDRLVITPLTDRCYITLAQAISLNMGGAPAGPAGTGKTETTKDMGKSLGKYVVVFNCSDQMDFRGLGQIFKGLSESGSWGCFDEFNRIDLSVLSVAAQQISYLLTARQGNSSVFTFIDGNSLKMNREFGIFITMNPGYAGRQELPENLKVMFRSCAMMVPDRQIIIRVKLASCGFKENIILARKFYTLYKLCENQLSHQIHYDFGLRNILSVLRTLGVQKRANVRESEQATLMRVLTDMNLSKLIAEDKPIFLSLMRDLFPKIKVFKSKYDDLQESIQAYAKEENLVNAPDWNLKVQQLYETCLVRHGIMVMGETFTGKTTAMEALVHHFGRLGQKYQTMKMNPKAITSAQMFGRLDVATNEWTDGIFSILFRRICKPKENEYFWIILDGPVDAIWIENLNSVLDDNKTLTLANGDRIIMSPNSKLMFETDNVNNASPATISRLGMVYLSSSVLQWQDILNSWVERTSKNIAKHVKYCFNDYFEDLLAFVTTRLSPKMKITENGYVKQCVDILDSLTKAGSNFEDRNVIQRLTLYAMIWSLGALLDANDRKRFQQFIKSQDTNLPWPKITGDQSFFDFFVNSIGEWTHWETNMPESIQLKEENFRFTRMIVPNVESVQLTYLLQRLWKEKRPVLMIGEQGTGKTITVQQLMEKFDSEENVTKTLNFSSLTTPDMFQKTIEGNVEKRTGAIYGPRAHKRLTLFIDDLNMPTINEWGDQTTNEIVRQLIENCGFYSLTKPGDFIKIQDLQFIAAMMNPGGGQNDIPNRLKRQFSIFTCTLPSENSIDKIFTTIAEKYFLPDRFARDIVNFYPTLVTMTRKLWQITKEGLLPSPAKFHYIFNLRDMSRIWQGILQIEPDECQNVPDLIKLWLHETKRVMSDRCIAIEDQEWFIGAQKKICEEMAEYSCDEDVLFVNFLRDIPDVDEEKGEDMDDTVLLEAPKVYEVVQNTDDCVKRIETFMQQYNETVRGEKLNLVLFRDALTHLIIISRIINMERGNALLVGIGGFGKRSLSKLATFIAGYEFHQVTLTTGYNTTNLLEDIKTAYKSAGLGNGVTFLFTDANVVDETFLDYLNNLLTSGEIPNLFTKEEYSEIGNELTTKLMKTGDPKAVYTLNDLIEKFTTSAKINFHMVLCFSPIGTSLRGWTIKFPGLMSGCTIDWFHDWPDSARLAVAQHVLRDFHIVCEDGTKESLIKSISDIHGCVEEVADEYFERFRRRLFVTPKKFLNFLESYKMLYVKKKLQIETMSERMSRGIQKLLDAADSINVLEVELREKEKDINFATEEANKALKLVEASTSVAEEARNKVMEIKTKAEELVSEIEKDKEVAEGKLELAKPALEEAERALLTIKPTDIATVRRLANPPHLVTVIMDAVSVLLYEKLDKVSMDKEKGFLKTSYKNSLKVMSGTRFLPRLRDFKKDRINGEIMDLLVPYLKYPKYNMSEAKKACGDVAGLLSWTIAMTKFYAVNRDVLPLKSALRIQEAKYEKAIRQSEDAEVMHKRTEQELAEIQKELDKTTAKKEMVLGEAAECNNKLSAATQLISGLVDEKVRWTKQIEQFKAEIQMLIGDIFYMCGFVSYSGAFNEEFRSIIMRIIREKLEENLIPHQKSLNLVQFFVDRSVVSEWLLYGLPDDDFSIQNGLIVTQADNFPLLIDPQSQGIAWIEQMEKQNELIVVEQNTKNFQMNIENAIERGNVVLLKDVNEKLDPCLTNVLNRNLMKSGTTLKVIVGDKEVTWNENFRLYITTKLENPHLSPEVSSAVNIVDFSVTMSGLENQLLGRVIRCEKAEMEQERIELIEGITRNMKTMEKLGADLLQKLSSIEGSILDDVSLIEMLNDSKNTSIDIVKKLASAEETEVKINSVRETYRPIARRGSILYFFMATLPEINHMYRTSLAQFLVKFDESLHQAPPSPEVFSRITSIIKKMTINIFRYQSRGLYEKHRYTFALLMALKIDVDQGKIRLSEFEYFIKGGSAVDASNVPKNPFNWLPDNIWTNITELAKLDQFSQLIDDMGSREKIWQVWYSKPNPENAQIPDLFLRQFHKLLLIRACCPDRVLSQSQKYIAESLGSEFLQPILINFKELAEESSAVSPIICLLSMGSDPTADITDLARKRDTTLHIVSMGQGQEVLARRFFEDVMSGDGGWILIQNSHLSLDFMDELSLTLAEREKAKKYPENTRIWITSAENEKYPISLLQRSIKYSNDPPSGLKAGLKMTYGNLTQDMLDFSNSNFYVPLIYTISFLHTVVQERRKYGPIGWNIPYEFNSADWLSSCMFIQNHLMEMKMRKGFVNWSAIRYMISEVFYGGRVTDDMDKRLLTAFTQMWFEASIVDENFYLRPEFSVVKCQTKEEYLDYFEKMDENESPEICGLHRNIEINYNIMVAENVFNTALAVQPKGSGAASKDGETRETQVSRMAGELLQKLPKSFDMHEVEERLAEMGILDPMAIFLRQEINSMQLLLSVIGKSLRDLQLAIDGMIVMSATLQDTMDALYDGKIPKTWEKFSWPTMEKLGFWFGDLLKRTKFLHSWCFSGRPNLFWIGGLFNPSGFLTAVRQEGVKLHSDWPLDSVNLDVSVLNTYARDCKKSVKEGVLAYGLVLEGAGWDRKHSSLCDLQAKVVHTPMPVFHIFAISGKPARDYDYYECPVYRTSERKHCVAMFRLRTVKRPQEKDTNWILRGTALITK